MCINPIKVKNSDGEEVEVKCGKCVLCRRNKCREWAIKLYHESQYHTKMCMITLTFRPKFLLTPKWKKLSKYKTIGKDEIGLPKRKKITYETCINPSYITDVRKTGWIVTLFIKKLRKHFEKENNYITYFTVGEHGTKNTHRAHWHILFFGIDKDSLNSVLYGQSAKGKDIYFSPIIDKLWSYDNVKCGMHTISEVNAKTIKYVANYTMKKMYNNNNNKFITTMRFSNKGKFGTKWARKYHKELRKGYLTDSDGIKYNIPSIYLKEMKRFYSDVTKLNYEYDKTAMEIELKRDENINNLKKKGLLTKEEQLKKAKRLEHYLSKTERDCE